jgi:GNAT superfamily N-acetyltransferase
MAVPPAVTVRTGGPAEAPAAAEFVEKVFREEFDLPVAELIAHDLETARWEFDEGRDLLLTAEAGGRTVGALLVLHDAPAPAPTVVFSWLAVDGAHRGHGVGRDLFARGLETCRQRGIVRIRARSFAVGAAAAHLYWMHGFRVVELSPILVAGRARESLLFEKLLTAPAEG